MSRLVPLGFLCYLFFDFFNHMVGGTRNEVVDRPQLCFLNFWHG